MAPDAPGADPRPACSSLTAELQAAVKHAVLGLDTWLESMRQPGGYGGPVVHWWRDCVSFTGPGLDWRYEGIIVGYLNLWAATGEGRWLAKARRAGDDLVAGQLPSGNFRNSCFELNPNTGGTPHEAAADLGLLRLAAALHADGITDWEQYARAAELNLRAYFITFLWDPRSQSFRDDRVAPSFVPNKAATLAEALLALAEVTGDEVWAERYALPTLAAVLEHQVQAGEHVGAIYQSSLNERRVARFFPYYIARCIPGLLAGYAWSGEARLAEAARRAAYWVLSRRETDGSWPQVVYQDGRVNRHPRWVAAAGDMLRALALARAVGVAYEEGPSLGWLLAGRQSNGAFHTAVGFGQITPFSRHSDARDQMPVVGWADKAFRYLSGLLIP